MRTRSVTFRVSAAELVVLRAAAATDRRILSDWLRLVALDAAAGNAATTSRERSIFAEPPVERDRDWNEL